MPSSTPYSFLTYPVYPYPKGGDHPRTDLTAPLVESSRIGPPVEATVAVLPGAPQRQGGPEVEGEPAEGAAHEPAEVGGAGGGAGAQAVEPLGRVGTLQGGGEQPGLLLPRVVHGEQADGHPLALGIGPGGVSSPLAGRAGERDSGRLEHGLRVPLHMGVRIDPDDEVLVLRLHLAEELRPRETTVAHEHGAARGRPGR